MKTVCQWRKESANARQTLQVLQSQRRSSKPSTRTLCAACIASSRTSQCLIYRDASALARRRRCSKVDVVWIITRLATVANLERPRAVVQKPAQWLCCNPRFSPAIPPIGQSDDKAGQWDAQLSTLANWVQAYTTSPVPNEISAFSLAKSACSRILARWHQRLAH